VKKKSKRKKKKRKEKKRKEKEIMDFSRVGFLTDDQVPSPLHP